MRIIGATLVNSSGRDIIGQENCADSRVVTLYDCQAVRYDQVKRSLRLRPVFNGETTATIVRLRG